VPLDPGEFAPEKTYFRLAGFTLLSLLPCCDGHVFIEPNVNPRIRVFAEFAEGFQFQHAQEGRVFGIAC
jgi:hypothetical protein